MTATGTPHRLCQAIYASTPFVPGNLLIQEDIDERDVITQWLSERRWAER